MEEITFTAGALWRKRIRHELKRAERHGAEWFETSGFLDSTFTIYAPEDTMDAIKKWLIKIEKAANGEL